MISVARALGLSISGTYRLPEGKEDDQLDAKNLDKGPMLGDVILRLNIELDQAVHGNSDRYRFDD